MEPWPRHDDAWYMERWVRGRGAIGDHLFDLYTHNPLWPLLGIESFEAHSWVIWDLINIAWLLEPAWVPSSLVRTPALGDDKCWHAQPGSHPLREGYAVQRDAIFGDFFATLDRAATRVYRPRAASRSSSSTTRSTPWGDR